MNPQTIKTQLVSLILLCPVAVMADLQDGLDAYNQQDYATAHREFLPLAEAGSRKARFYLGVMYLRGEAVPRDRDRAETWFDFAGEETSETPDEPSVRSIRGTVPHDFGRSVLAVYLGSNENLNGAFSLEDAVRAYGNDYLQKDVGGNHVRYTWSYIGETLTRVRVPPAPQVGEQTTPRLTTGKCRLSLVADRENQILEVGAEGNACASVLDTPEIWRERHRLYLTRPPDPSKMRKRETAVSD